MDGRVPIEEELSLVRSYIFIEQVRFEERLQVVWEVDECGALQIPFLSIQPLVENAIRHGIMKRTREGNIHIQICAHDTYAEIAVKDDGVGMNEAELKGKRHFGTGLQKQAR